MPATTMTTTATARRRPAVSPPRSGTRLPAELIDIVIDYLHEDEPALLSFALVSRRWLRSTRYHLFHHVRVLPAEDPTSAFLPFLHFLDSNPHIGHFIRELELCGNERKHRTTCGDFAVLDGDQLIPIIRHLPFLLTLILSQVYAVAPSATGSWMLFTMPIHKLVLNEIYSDCEGAQWLITVFKVCDTLHILDPIPVPTKPSPAIMNMPVDSFNLLDNVKSLVIESRNDPMSLGKVEGLMPFIMNKIDSLELLLELEHKEEVGRLEAFIKSKGAVARHLRLDISDVEILQKQHGVNLTAVCPHLQSLHLCLFSASPCEIAADHWGYGSSVIANGPRTVRQITIGMVSAETPCNLANVIDWCAFEAAILSLKHIESVKFQVESVREGWRTTAECAQRLDEEWKECLVQHLPQLRTRGLLRFLE